MIANSFQTCKNLLACRSGNVAIIFGLAVAPLVAIAGVVLDYSLARDDRSNLQVATDAAAIAAAQAQANGSDEPEMVARRVFRSTINIAQDVADVQVRREGERYIVSATQTRPTRLLSLIGINTISVGAESEAIFKASGSLEFAIALDTSRSMLYDQLEWNLARDAMQQFIQAAYDSRLAGVEVVGSLIPFGDRVRVGSRLQGWTDAAPPPDWLGCVDVRATPDANNPNRLGDEPPDVAPLAYFTPFSAVSPNGQDSMFLHCPHNEMAGPTAAPGQLISVLPQIRTIGSGRFDEGMAWAWRALSPKWRGHWPVVGPRLQNTESPMRVAVLITDGRTETYRYEVLGADGTTRVFGQNLGSQLGFDNLVQVCNEMKDAGITVHVIGLSGNPQATPFLRACASEGSFYPIEAISEFIAAFRKITATLYPVRLAR